MAFILEDAPSSPRYVMEDAPAPSFKDLMLQRETSDLSANLRRGARDVIDTGAEGLAYAWDKLTGADPARGEYARVKAMDDAGKAKWADENAGQILPQIQRLGGNALATAPLTAAAGAGAAAAGLPRLGAAISSAGMEAGGARGAAGVALRALGGGINGGVSAGMVDPQAAPSGVFLGAVTPPILQGLGAGVRAARNAYRARGDIGLARDIANMAGAQSPEEMAAVRDALRQQGPTLIPGAEPTAAQILQQPGVSQLQRSVKAASPSILAEREAQQNAARLEALNRIAPVSGTVQQAAEDAGNSIAAYAIPAREAAKTRATRLFESVDPFGETRINLPIDEMQAARAKYLGPGTFGGGGAVNQAIRTAQDIGTEVLPGVTPARTGRSPQSLVQAVRAAGGISPASSGGMTGEITELGRKQSGTTGLVSGKGLTVDRMAELMRQRGFIPDEDPATLLNAIRSNLAGETVYGADVGDNAFRGALERAMGDAPEASRIAKPVTYQEVQNLRSSIGEAARTASQSGNMREAAALRQMVSDLDARVAAVGQGHGAPGEYFPPDITDTWKQALAAHRARKLRFDTGPQASLFRVGGDGQPLIQGAEVPSKFFSSSRSQVENAQSFRRLVNDDPGLMQDLRRYAITDAAGQVDRLGNLTSAKFNRWLDARSGATGVLFTDQQKAILRGVANDLRRSDAAESLGRSTGSDTMQKAANMLRLGLLDHPGMSYVASKIPGGQAGLGLLRGPAMRAKAERFAGLLANPEKVGGLLDTYLGAQQPQLGLLSLSLNPALARTAPLMLTNQ